MQFLKHRKNLIFKLILILSTITAINYYVKYSRSENPSNSIDSSDYQNIEGSKSKLPIDQLKNLEQLNQDDEKPNVIVVDLNSPLEPSSVYEPIQCRKSAEIHVSTTLCVHNLENDKFVSQEIWTRGVWEGDLVRDFTDYINQNPDWLVLDVGAQIGQYSLFAAKMDRHVVTVEPFYDNVIRIHKASVQESLQNRITLIKNAISNKRNEVKKLMANPTNIGGQSLLGDNNVYKKENGVLTDKYLVETILFDDIIPFLPKNKENKDYEKAIMKIDIEGFEPYAFQNAKKLFEKLNFQIIFMEWGNLPPQISNHKLILEMMDFLYSRNFKAFRNLEELDKNKWLTWPMDIVWKKF